MSGLAERVAIVTGSASGIGRAIAAEFARAGATLAAVDLDGDAAERVAEELRGHDAEAVALAADVARAGEVEAMAAAVFERFGRIDVLVNNAGIRHISGFLEHGEAEWRRTLDVNLTGPFLCMKAVIPYMLRTGKGKVVNLASIASFVGRPDRAAYCAAKGGLVSLTQAAALDMAGRNVYVNALAPGLIDTPFNSMYSSNPELAERWAKENLVGRWGQPADVAKAALFLASDDSDFVNGAVLPVEGGWLAARRRVDE